MGLEREWRDRAAGLRTHTLVAFGSTLFTLLSLYGMNDWIEYSVAAEGNRALFTADPGRIAAQIVAGIGFIGAGAIWRSRTSVQGVTTAASLWMVAAIGMAIGMGWYVPAVVSTVAILLVLTGLRSVSNMLPHKDDENGEQSVEMRITLASASSIEPLLQYFADQDLDLARTRVHRAQGNTLLEVSFVADQDQQAKVVGAVAAMPGVHEAELDSR